MPVASVGNPVCLRDASRRPAHSALQRGNLVVSVARPVPLEVVRRGKHGVTRRVVGLVEHDRGGVVVKLPVLALREQPVVLALGRQLRGRPSHVVLYRNTWNRGSADGEQTERQGTCDIRHNDRNNRLRHGMPVSSVLRCNPAAQTNHAKPPTSCVVRPRHRRRGRSPTGHSASAGPCAPARTTSPQRRPGGARRCPQAPCQTWTEGHRAP